MPPVIRLATGDDAGDVLAIYAPIIRNTAISFEFDVPSESEIRRRILTTLEKFPWLVCERRGKFLGYCYAGPHEERAAYQWAADVSVYVHADARQMGVGRAMYRSLFDLLTLQGINRIYAGITLPNEASVGLHESLGFRSVGVYQRVGYKFGRWHDVGWWQSSLKEHDNPPEPPVNLPEIGHSPQWQAAMESGLSLLRP